MLWSPATVNKPFLEGYKHIKNAWKHHSFTLILDIGRVRSSKSHYAWLWESQKDKKCSIATWYCTAKPVHRARYCFDLCVPRPEKVVTPSINIVVFYCQRCHWYHHHHHHQMRPFRTWRNYICCLLAQGLGRVRVALTTNRVFDWCRSSPQLY